MTALGLLIPFAGTTLGSAMVFFMRKNINPKLEKILLGFAAGVMMAASVWSLLIPSIEMSSGYRLEFVPAAIGFLSGIVFLLVLDGIIPNLYVETRTEEKVKNDKPKKKTMMILAVTLHNIPEGMAVGVTLAAAMKSGSQVTAAAATALSIGIAIQNFPEGAIVSMPLKSGGMSKPKAFLIGTLSGVVEPLFGLLTVIVTSTVISVLPYLLSFAAGAMIYVIVEELIPESQIGKHSSIATVGLAFGFVVMMVLDVTFG